MGDIKLKIKTGENVKIVTANDFITAVGLADLGLKERKLLYIAISQCRKTDQEFFQYELSIKEFADIMGIAPQNVYSEADKITDNLLRALIKVEFRDAKKTMDKFSLFSRCHYEEDGMISFKLNQDMTDFLLQLKGNFSQPLLQDFMHMNSPYSMAIWHLMQMKMQSKKPLDPYEFTLSVDELRKVTGTEKKFKQIGQFKKDVLDKAIREIKDNCGMTVDYANIKKSRTIVGFNFVVRPNLYLDSKDMTEEQIDKFRRIDLIRKSFKQKLSENEETELKFLSRKLNRRYGWEHAGT